MIRNLILSLFFLSGLPASFAQAASPAPGGEELKFVVYVSRHGVRSPTSPPEQYNTYSKAPWPAWDVPPGYLTRHGYHLMEIFGVYDRALLSQQGLLHTAGCEDAAHVTVHADSDQRTRETGSALAEGMFPGCKLTVQAQAEGSDDVLFHSLAAGLGKADQELAVAAIGGRIGGQPENLTAAYRSQIAALDRILAECGTATEGTAPSARRTLLFDVPARLALGRGDHAAELKGPLNTASTLAENLLLEYTEGMESSKVGWGCVDAGNLRTLLDLHTAATDFTQRTEPIARMQASNLLEHVRQALEQAATGKSVAGAPSSKDDVALFLVGHDTNLTNIGGLLNLTWIFDGRRNDTPPGGALVFELWRTRSGEFSVRTYFTAQTLEQMRFARTLTLDAPPARVPVFLPACSDQTMACPWAKFTAAISAAEDRQYVSVP